MPKFLDKGTQKLGARAREPAKILKKINFVSSCLCGKGFSGEKNKSLFH